MQRTEEEFSQDNVVLLQGQDECNKQVIMRRIFLPESRFKMSTDDARCHEGRRRWWRRSDLV
jgi:hypothetical protein